MVCLLCAGHITVHSWTSPYRIHQQLCKIGTVAHIWQMRENKAQESLLAEVTKLASHKTWNINSYFSLLKPVPFPFIVNGDIQQRRISKWQGYIWKQLGITAQRVQRGPEQVSMLFTRQTGVRHCRRMCVLSISHTVTVGRVPLHWFYGLIGSSFPFFSLFTPMMRMLFSWISLLIITWK